ncbi:MAG TPA: 2Fe-2S ferredoxin [Paenibacillaceae bacterium]|nr:2Fe-2S ferredoxin [Paenibacillaceae bacterium]
MMMNPRLKALKKHIFYCGSEHCNGQDAEAVIDAFKEQFVEHGIHKEVKVNKTSCLGMCGNGPFILVYPEGIWYYNVTVDDVPRIVEEHFVGKEPVEELVLMRMEG